MMSLFRILLILVVIIMILPVGNDAPEATGPAPQSQVSTGQFVDAAVSAAYDVSGICSRQPVVCTIGHELWTTFQRKSLFIIGAAYDWLNGSREQASPLIPRDQSATARETSKMEGGTGPRSDRLENQSDTLTERDLLVPWRGPAGPAG